jgi:hypothetical protein
MTFGEIEFKVVEWIGFRIGFSETLVNTVMNIQVH